MGGFGSGRWGWHLTRTDTDGLLFLDVRYLARHGYLAAGPGFLAAGLLTWSCRGEETGRIGVEYRGDDPDAVILDYQTRRPGGEWQPVRERVALARTDCHYGGARPWFLCPRCFERRAVLYSVGGRFRCRACHDLAYSSTREAVDDRMLRRAGDIQRKLGNRAHGTVWDLPPKPKGMHRRTYRRLVAELHETHYRALAEFAVAFGRLQGNFERLTRRD